MVRFWALRTSYPVNYIWTRNIFLNEIVFHQDLVVGAPYDGPDGRGAIYIFLGSLDGISKKPSQVKTHSMKMDIT